MRRGCVLAGVVAAVQLCVAQSVTRAAIPYDQARPILGALSKEVLPRELAELPAGEIASRWPEWIVGRNMDIRARLERGDEDTVINFLLFGTTFTQAARATDRDVAALARTPTLAATSFAARVDDLAAGIAAPHGNDRLAFARQVITQKGIDPDTAGGRDQLRRYLRDGLARVATEVAIYDRAIESAELAADPSVEFVEKATLFRGRGLSSDTSLFTDHAIDRALRAIRANGTLESGGVHRVGIVGPGLDFTDKHEGFDFYPPQTIQPFAVADSLIRLGLAASDDLKTMTFDLSPRINQHLDAARRRAKEGEGYLLQLPRDMGVAWHPDLVGYWERFGDQIGAGTPAAAVPANSGDAESRALLVRPSVVLSIEPQDVNIVAETQPGAKGTFDLIVATNILIYYDTFEQSLALSNIAAMLRPGGILVANGRLVILPVVPLDAVDHTDVIYTYRPDRGETGDRIAWYRRQ